MPTALGALLASVQQRAAGRGHVFSNFILARASGETGRPTLKHSADVLLRRAARFGFARAVLVSMHGPFRREAAAGWISGFAGGARGLPIHLSRL
jgi:hypothetical protein